MTSINPSHFLTPNTFTLWVGASTQEAIEVAITLLLLLLCY